MRRLHIIYFSAKNTTKRIADTIAQGVVCGETLYHSLLLPVNEKVTISSDDIVIIAVPVYAGRVPAIVAERLLNFKGDNTPTILAVTYGNREIDDALIELSDISKSIGFAPISAGEFVCQHSIFPKVATNRPNSVDLALAKELGEGSNSIVADMSREIAMGGKRPYREVSRLPITPTTSRHRCNHCGICAAQCPVGAIGTPKPKTDENLCIKCGRCIVICPKDARGYRSIKYKIAHNQFAKRLSIEKSSKLYF